MGTSMVLHRWPQVRHSLLRCRQRSARCLVASVMTVKAAHFGQLSADNPLLPGVARRDACGAVYLCAITLASYQTASFRGSNPIRLIPAPAKSGVFAF